MYPSGFTVFQFAYTFMNLHGRNLFKLKHCMCDCFHILFYITITGGGGGVGGGGHERFRWQYFHRCQ